MASICKLPENYKESMELNLQKDRSLRCGIAVWAAIIWAIMIYHGNQVQPIRRFWSGEMHQVAYAFLGIILYMILHETVHGIFMFFFGGKRPKYGVEGPFTYASSSIYFRKFQYEIIALAPTLIWGTVLLILCKMNQQTQWFWTFYLLEIVNITGAVSDLYVVIKCLMLPKNVLIQDTGTAIIVYGKS